MRKFLWLITVLSLFNGVLIALVLMIARALPPGPLLAFTSEGDRTEGSGYVYIVDVYHRLPMRVSSSSNMFIDPAWSDDGALVFTYFELNGNTWDVEVMKGSQRRKITLTPSQYGSFTWSRDGRLAFEFADSDGTTGILIWDGAALYDLDTDLAYMAQPRWSADGRLAFVFFQPGYYGVMVWDGTNTVIASPPELSNSYHHTWSPDGRLAFLSDMDGSGNRDIFVWDGTESRNITQQPALYNDLAWSYDGRLAFVGDDGVNFTISVWNGETIATIYTSTSITSRTLHWSIDGRLAFTSMMSGNQDIYVWDGQSLINISQHPALDDLPAWSADGWLAFVSNRDGEWDTYIWDGSTPYPVTNTPGWDSQPYWWPLPD